MHLFLLSLWVFFKINSLNWYGNDMLCRCIRCLYGNSIFWKKEDFTDFLTMFFLEYFLGDPFHAHTFFRFGYLNTNDFPRQTPVIKTMLCREFLYGTSTYLSHLNIIRSSIFQTIYCPFWTEFYLNSHVEALFFHLTGPFIHDNENFVSMQD